MKVSNNMIIGIDASNLRLGGGLTHLIEVLSAVNIHKHNISKVIIWGGEQSLSQISNFPWLKKIIPEELNHSLFSRLMWQKFRLSTSAKDNNCDLIFSPGGSVLCNFRPIVTMSQNILPFEWSEAKRYGFSLEALRLILLWQLQSKTFRSADGVIFLTNYAKKQVTKVVGKIKGSSVIIPHGLNSRFCIYPKKQHDISDYTLTKPFNILYVSTVDRYKHQWNVVEAVAKLRKEGYPVALNLVGAVLFAKNLLEKSLKKFDANSEWANYHESVPYLDMHNIYKDANLGVFASSCENLPIILIETMASGLPIACSNKGPMPEVLGKAGEYFNPENPAEIYHSIKKLIDNIQLRSTSSEASFNKAQEYNWDKCAFETFSYLEEVFLNFQKT
jgi:glycosyltransferase involved in cell wall biosynthesis